MRGPYEGMWNVVRVNWAKYILGLGVVLVSLTCAWLFSSFRSTGCAIGLMAIVAVLLPLVVSHIIYDRSHLHRMPWLVTIGGEASRLILNLNAGFDESSSILKHHFPQSELVVVDLFDAERCTEPSIARARKAYPPFPGTLTTRHGVLPLPTASVQRAVAFLSLHEVRSHTDRVAMLKEIHRVLTEGGSLVITEHLRDLPNMIAFTIGVFHFHSGKAWVTAFEEAGFRVARKHRTAGFITTFILQPV